MIFLFSKMFYSTHLLLCGENVKIVSEIYEYTLYKDTKKGKCCKIPIFEVFMKHVAALLLFSGLSDVLAQPFSVCVRVLFFVYCFFPFWSRWCRFDYVSADLFVIFYFADCFLRFKKSLKAPVFLCQMQPSPLSCLWRTHIFYWSLTLWTAQQTCLLIVVLLISVSYFRHSSGYWICALENKWDVLKMWEFIFLNIGQPIVGIQILK